MIPCEKGRQSLRAVPSSFTHRAPDVMLAHVATQSERSQPPASFAAQCGYMTKFWLMETSGKGASNAETCPYCSLPCSRCLE